MLRFTRFSLGKIWFIDIGPCKRFDIFQVCSWRNQKFNLAFLHIKGFINQTIPKPSKGCKLQGHSCNIGNAPNLVEKNWILRSVCFWRISDMVLYLLKWEKQGASLNFVPTHLFGKIQDFFVPGTYWQFLLKSHANAWISFARPWKSHYNLQIKHTNWKNAFAFKFSIRFDFFWPKSELVIFSWIL